MSVSSTCGRARADRGNPIFVDELERFAADVRDRRCAAIADRLAAPLRAAVSGRAGVGLTTATQALTRAGLLVVTPESEADLHVHLVAEVVKPEDRIAIATAARPVLTVLTKADLIAVTDAGRHPLGPTHAARARCLQLSVHTGLPVEPLVGLLAVAVLDDRVDDALWVGLRVIADGGSVAAPVRRRLVDVLGVFGLTQAAAAVRRGATRIEVMMLLRQLSCIDDVLDAIEVLGIPQRYQRILDAVADLQVLAVTDPRISAFLTRDHTVVARMTAAVDVVEAAGQTVDRGETADAHLRRAVHWQRAEPPAGVHGACCSDIVRGSLRRWVEVGGTV